MFERPEQGERAILVHVELPDETVREDLHEFKELVASAGVEVIDVLTTARKQPDVRHFVGKGFVDKIQQALNGQSVDVILFNHELSPSQERNLEQQLKCRVLDRTELILDIFAQRASSFEGKLQVELAQLEHLSTRLIRGWTHLERQKGGIGLRGPGETQLETDRRLLRARVKAIKARLDKVRSQRQQSRRARQRAAVPTVSLVGYTNAGKSTLFRLLTEADVYVADQLFATLDPTLRKMNLPTLGDVILADTVGFIRHLPHSLVAAFRATLEETLEAALLIHVIDVSDPEQSKQIEEVESVLNQIGAEDVPRLFVFNKIDKQAFEPKIVRNESGDITEVWLSAAKGLGDDLLKLALVELLSRDILQCELKLPAEHSGPIRAALYQQGGVVTETTDEDANAVIQICLPRLEVMRIFNSLKLDWREFVVTPDIMESPEH